MFCSHRRNGVGRLCDSERSLYVGSVCIKEKAIPITQKKRLEDVNWACMENSSVAHKKRVTETTSSTSFWPQGFPRKHLDVEG